MSVVEFQTMPPLSSEEYQNLEASILEQGIQVPVIVDERGVVIDGHHRERIASEHGLHVPVEVREGMTDAQKIALSISLNVNRRQLTREQRREIIAASLKAEPAASNSEHARRTGASDKTVQALRTDLERRSEIPNVEQRTDSLGRQQPAARPTVKHSETTTTKDEWTADAETGEVIDEPPAPAPAAPSKPRRGSLVEDAWTARRELVITLGRLQAIRADDRFTKNKADIQDALRPVVGLANEVLPDFA